ncbi:MAG: hypothetical protein ACQESR_29875 [Planctomycetota bacterium]
MESCPTQAVRPLMGLAADKVIRDRYNIEPFLARWSLMFQSRGRVRLRRAPRPGQAGSGFRPEDERFG